MSLRQNRPYPVDRLSQLNDPGAVFKQPEQLAFVRSLIDIIREITAQTIYRDTAAPHVILVSPNGTAYRITVADDGTLTTINART